FSTQLLVGMLLKIFQFFSRYYAMASVSSSIWVIWWTYSDYYECLKSARDGRFSCRFRLGTGVFGASARATRGAGAGAAGGAPGPSNLAEVVREANVAPMTLTPPKRGPLTRDPHPTRAPAGTGRRAADARRRSARRARGGSGSARRARWSQCP